MKCLRDLDFVLDFVSSRNFDTWDLNPDDVRLLSDEIFRLRSIEDEVIQLRRLLAKAVCS